jgi:hypothetical protein
MLVANPLWSATTVSARTFASLIFGHIEIRQLAEVARARRLMCGVGVAHAFTDAPNPIQFGE